MPALNMEIPIGLGMRFEDRNGRKTKIPAPMFYVGPMSKNVVDAIGVLSQDLDSEDRIGILPSRRQVEFDGGYANNWTTEGLREYLNNIPKAQLILERDHGGPGQGLHEDDGVKSLAEDAKFCDIIHVDPWKRYQELQEGIDSTVHLIEHLVVATKQAGRPHVVFEVGTEEAIRAFTCGEVEILLRQLKMRLSDEAWQRIHYVVVQSGTALDLGNRQNIGVYNRERLIEMMRVVKKYGKCGKEHNGDYLSVEQCRDRFAAGVHALNIAPAFGQIETECILNVMQSLTPEYFDSFYDICYRSRRWEKWVKNIPGFSPIKDRYKLCLIAGHYVLSDPEWLDLKVDIESAIQKSGPAPTLDETVIVAMKDFFSPYLKMAQELRLTFATDVLEPDMQNRAGGLHMCYYGGESGEGVDDIESIIASSLAKVGECLQPPRIVFSEAGCPYYYAASLFSATAQNAKKQTLEVDYLSEYTIFLKPDSTLPLDIPTTPAALFKLKNVQVQVTLKAKVGTHTQKGSETVVKQMLMGDVLDVRGYDATICVSQGVPISDQEIPEECSAFVLVAGVPQNQVPVSDLFCVETARDEVKKLCKPWGHELWLTMHNTSYVIKEIMLKAGRKTSLQYHNMKQESNVLFAGRGVVHYKKNPIVANDDVKPTDVGQQLIWPLSCVNVSPPLLHRVEALSDLLLYESSTPHLDDIVRVTDDTNRARDGRIVDEHQTQVCILAAGRDKGLSPHCDEFNKALLPLGNEATITRIISQFPPATKFVIALGFMKEQLKSYLSCAHPNLNAIFVEIDDWDSPAAGPGVSLLACREALGGDRPFYFLCCDCVIRTENTPIPTSDLHLDWIGVASVSSQASEKYCNFSIEGKEIVSMHNKVRYKDDHSKSFVGLAHLRHAKEFWKGLEDALKTKSPEMVWGLEHLIKTLPSKERVVAHEFDWLDIGSLDKYQEAVAQCVGVNCAGFNFDKADECLYFTKTRVIKYFKEAKFAELRVARSRLAESVFAPVDISHGQFFSYKFVKGKTLYQNCDCRVFKALLEFAKSKLWVQPSSENSVDPATFSRACDDFYRNKTLKRVKLYMEKYPNQKTKAFPYVNGVEQPDIEELLHNDKFPWKRLVETAKPVFFHGDLQFDNILYDESSTKFVLLDWRQDFSGLLNVGDQYYDLAKLYGGLVLNYDLVKQNRFSYSENRVTGDIVYDFETRFSTLKNYASIYETFLAENGLSLAKVKLLVGIIYLNMAPLHHYPFDKMLWAMARCHISEGLKIFSAWQE